MDKDFQTTFCVVSTHSRLKAAAIAGIARPCGILGFNTQPPEGGCMAMFNAVSLLSLFQHTAA